MYSTAEAAALQLKAATQHAGASQSHVMLPVHASAHEQFASHSCTTAVVRPYCKFGYGKIMDVGTFSFR